MSTIRLMLDGQVQGFEIHRLPANKQVTAQFAVRDTVSDMTLIVGANGKIYSDQIHPKRSWSWQHRIGDRVASVLKAAGIITQAQHDSHAAACKEAREIDLAYWDLKSLTGQAEKYGIELSGGKLDELRALAALYKE